MTLEQFAGGGTEGTPTKAERLKTSVVILATALVATDLP